MALSRQKAPNFGGARLTLATRRGILGANGLSSRVI